MRILMTADTVGGVWTFTVELIKELLLRKVAVALVTVGPAPSPSQTEWLQETKEEYGGDYRWEVCSAPLEWMNGNDLAYREAEGLLLLLAQEFGAELLHTNQYCFGALPLKLPKLVVAHSDVLSWAVACRDIPLPPSAWLHQYCSLVTAGLQGADAVVTPTRWMLSALAANFPLPAKSFIIHNGRTLHFSRPAPKRRLQAVIAGRLWDEAKNVAFLQQVQSPFPILVAGETNYEWQGTPVMPANVSLLGKLEENDLLQLLRESSIYLCTSRYEPFGLAPLEAALCGCAVMAYDIPSLREVWGDGALYFSDSASLSTMLAGLSDHPDQLMAAQHRSGQQALHYTAAAMAENYLRLYRSMLTPAERACRVA